MMPKKLVKIVVYLVVAALLISTVLTGVGLFLY